MQDLLAIWLLLMLALTLAGLAVSIIWDVVQEYRVRRAWEKRIKANRDEIFRDIERRG